MRIEYLNKIAYEVPEECVHCGHNEFGHVRKAGPHIALQCENCGGWVFAKQCKSKNWAEMVKIRAGYKCERCGKQGKGRGLHAHHKVPVWFMPRWQYDPDNGMCLCTECHKQIHGGCGVIKNDEQGGTK